MVATKPDAENIQGSFWLFLGPDLKGSFSFFQLAPKKFGGPI
jgi:hypothetical protein